MTIEEILAGESKNVEFKVSRPKDGKKYTKSVIAFANVISDSCEPMIIPDISLREISGKTLIVVEIAPGMQRPYYLKSMGIQEGTFMRIAGTTRPVESYTLRELLLDGSDRSFDSIPLEDQTVSEEEVKQLCTNMTEYAKRSCRTDEERRNVRPLTKNQLLSWELLVERNGRLLPTYGFNLLAGKAIPSVMYAISTAAVPDAMKKVPESAGDNSIDVGALPEQHEKIYKYIKSNGQITSAQTEKLLDVKPRRARAVLGEMVKADVIKKVGAAKNTKYVLH